MNSQKTNKTQLTNKCLAKQFDTFTNQYKSIKMKINLSKRELLILQMIADGLISKQIGAQLYISQLTVDTHRKNIMRKLNAINASHMVFLAIQEGYLPMENKAA